MKKLMQGLRGFGLAVLCLCLSAGAGVCAHAADDTEIGTLYEVTTDTEMKEAADAGSATLSELKAGTAVVVESDDGVWSKVLYRETEGYVASDVLEVYAEDELASLAQEMGGVAEDEQRFVEETEVAIKQKRTSMIWGSVIAVLILAIFALGVVSAVKNAKEEEEKEKEDGGKQDKKAEEIEIADMDEEESGQ